MGRTYTYMSMGEQPSKGNKNHVTIRVPSDISEAVMRYAADNEISKTDAYVHFIELGLVAEARESTDQSLKQASILIRHALSILDSQTKTEG